MYFCKYLKRVLLSSLLICSVYPQSLSAQSADSVSSASFSPSLSLSGTYSPISFRAWGKMLNTNHYFLRLGYNHTEVDLFSLKTHLGSELIISGMINFPVDGRDGERESLYGFGMVPFIANMPLSNKDHFPYITSSLGFIITDRHFPNLDGARFNFLLGTGIGYQFQTGDNHSIQVGYKLHHLSNGYMSLENPGIDSIMIFFNILFHY